MLILKNTKPRPVMGVSFGPDGRTLAAGGSEGFDLWDLSKGTHRHISTKSTKRIWAFSFDPLGRWLYLSDLPEVGRMFVLETGEVRRFPISATTANVPNHMTSIAAAADGTRVAISRGGSDKNQIECWRISRAGKFTLGWSVPAGKWGMFRGLTFAPNGRTLADVEELAGPRTFQFSLRDAVTGKVRSNLGTLPLTSVAVHSLFVPDGKHLLAWGDDWLELWDVTARKRIGQTTPPGRSYFRGLAVHPSGKFFATAGDANIRYWDVAALQQIEVRKSTIGKLHSIAFSADGSLAAAGGDKGLVAVWDAQI